MLVRRKGEVMSTEINIKKIVGYFLIYFMLIWNQTNLGEIYLKNYSLLILFFFAIVLFLQSKKMSIWCGMCLISLIWFAIILRYTVGGIGMQAIISFFSSVYITGVTVVYNKEKVLTRVFNTIVFLAIVSLILWLLCLILPNFYEKYVPLYRTPMTYKLYIDSHKYKEFYYMARGLFLYTMREVDKWKNTGIFTEPGIYQMVLNTGIFIGLFMNEKIFCKKLKYKLLILVITLFTTQSTTGMIGIIVILFFYLTLSYKKKNIFSKKNFLILICCAIVLLFIDYQIRDTESIFYISIIEKLFPKGRISLVDNASSFARVGTILISIKSMIQHPLGIGYDNLHLLLKTEETGFVAAEILAFGAVWGIFPLTFVLWWIFSPLYNKISKNINFLFIILYVNTLLAQSSMFYPILILIPLTLKYGAINNIIKKNKEK